MRAKVRVRLDGRMVELYGEVTVVGKDEIQVRKEAIDSIWERLGAQNSSHGGFKKEQLTVDLVEILP